ncbi:MAG: ERF family protein [Bacteroidia bacterium]|nr:ERF family protein [Bacteroidia bacterium]
METTEIKQPEIFNAILNIMEGLDPIKKNKENKQQSYKYRGVEDVYSSLNPMLIANKVILIPELLSHTLTDFNSKSGSLLFRAIVSMKYTFKSTIDGSEASCIMTGEGMDTGDKATPKAISGAFKYMAFQMFCIPVPDDADSEKEDHEVKGNAPQQSQPSKAIVPNQNADKKEPEKWLNRTNKAGEVTPEWTNILKGISDAKITSVQDVRKYYKVSKATQTDLEEALQLI